MNNENKFLGENDRQTTRTVKLISEFCLIACSFAFQISARVPVLNFSPALTRGARRKRSLVAGVHIAIFRAHSYYVQSAKGQSLYYDLLLLALEALFLKLQFRLRLQGVCRKAPRAQGWGGTERRQLTLANPAWLSDSCEHCNAIYSQAQFLSDSSHSSLNLTGHTSFVCHILALF